MARDSHGTAEIDIGIVTALSVERAAMLLYVDDLIDEPASRDPNLYRSGRLPSRVAGRPHRVVVAQQAQDGTRNAAAICTDLARSFPSLRCVVMCGIAAGVPKRGVGLGDIISATDGIVDYDHVRAVDGRTALRRTVEGLSKALLRADRELETDEHLGHRPWLDLLRRDVPPTFARPQESPGDPRVHRGAVASADRLVRDAALRDALSDRYRVCALEMEASGVAVGSDLYGLHWYMVRGVADHADHRKSDHWHRYASLAAAAYVRTLLQACPPLSGDGGSVTGPSGSLSAATVGSMVDALLGLRVMRDDYQRRTVLSALPDRIRTAIADNVVGRLHVVETVRACMDFPDGRDALIDALRLTLGADSPELARVEAVVRENWNA